MATEEGNIITLKVLVDKQRNRVVFVEAGKDFVNILLSFLTMPLGTIVRLARKQKQPCVMGCMENLYQSLDNFDSALLVKKSVKEMLLRPKNPAGALCSKLKINIDDREPMKYYVCQKFLRGMRNSNFKHTNALFSTFLNVTCKCGGSTDTEILLDDENVNEGVFIKGLTFMVSDDLQIKPIGTGPIFTYLTDLGIRGTDSHALEERTITIGVDESLLFSTLLTVLLITVQIFGLLRVSSTPLTEVLLSNGTLKLKSKDITQTPRSEDITQSSKSEDTENLDTEMSVKITVVKFNNKVVYAETGEDFVDFLFSLLMLPLGSVVKLLDQTPRLQCFSNLYKSVECPLLSRHVKPTKALLLSPMVDPHFDCKNQRLRLEMFQPKYYLKSWKSCEFLEDYYLVNGILTVNASLTTRTSEILKPIDADKPSPPCEFVKGPATFIITDDLIVIPFSFISCISLLEKENISMDNVDAQVVSIGRKEVSSFLSLLDRPTNLYKSVECPTFDGCMCSLSLRELLLSPKVASHHGCNKKPLEIEVIEAYFSRNDYTTRVTP
ncbi:hypothetical protein GIB67_007667 [Kingdonia uniflora]|uniref:DUF674 family protein n=1 Tax=Kingdonia uniflora TaxID=39325 RepID=A0A7J7N1L1_9MAGN|nr:hypothetical protein GIB67_007667 [Kingdonia uniflora]